MTTYLSVNPIFLTAAPALTNAPCMIWMTWVVRGENQGAVISSGSHWELTEYTVMNIFVATLSDHELRVSRSRH